MAERADFIKIPETPGLPQTMPTEPEKRIASSDISVSLMKEDEAHIAVRPTLLPLFFSFFLRVLISSLFPILSITRANNTGRRPVCRISRSLVGETGAPLSPPTPPLYARSPPRHPPPPVLLHAQRALGKGDIPPYGPNNRRGRLVRPWSATPLHLPPQRRRLLRLEGTMRVE